MQKVYVTESGFFDENDRFQVRGVIGVDSISQLAVSYPISMGCYRHHVDKDDISLVLFYKQPFSSKGYRVTVIEMY